MKLYVILSSLIEEIHVLYNQVSLTLLHRRMKGYHDHVNFSVSPHATDIKSPLLDCITHVVIHDKGVEVSDVSNEVGSPVLGAGESKKKTPAPEKNDATKDKGETANPYMLDKKKQSVSSPGILRLGKKGVRYIPLSK